MKKIILILCTLSISFSGYSQSKKQLKAIIKEANLLYSYEKAAWISSDLAVLKKEVKENFGDYLVYHSNDTIFSIFVDTSRKKRIAKYAFTEKNLNTPFKTDFEVVDISDKEASLLKIKYSIVNKLSDKKYGITIPEGYSPNLILIKDKKEYRFYVIMGATKPDIIPFGNDFIFYLDENGKVDKWKKFHTTMIPAKTKINGSTIISAFHTHLRSSPYITATDICTFRLYAESSGMKEFSVLSTKTKKKYTYNITKNKIKVSKI